MPSFQDVIAPITIANYALGAWDGISKHNPAIKALRAQADWEYDVGGDHLEGVIESGRNGPIITVPGQDLSPVLQPTVRYARWSLPAFGEVTTPLIVDIGALRKNNGPQALVKMKDKEIPAMVRDTILASNGILSQFFTQNINAPTGAGATTGLPLVGLPSFLLAPGSSGLNGFDGNVTYTGTTVASTDREAVATTQTFAGLSIAPNGLAGINNLQVDAWTPTLVNSTSTAWNGSASASTNILIYLQWAVNRAKRFNASDPQLNPDPMTSGWLSYDYFQFLGQAIALKQTIYLQDKAGNTVPNTPTGFDSDGVPHAGMMWHWDQLMPGATGYIINWKQMMAKVQQLYVGIEGNGNPLGKSGEDAGILETAITWDPVRRQWICTATFPGQFMYSPRYFVRVGAYA